MPKTLVEFLMWTLAGVAAFSGTIVRKLKLPKIFDIVIPTACLMIILILSAREAWFGMLLLLAICLVFVIVHEGGHYTAANLQGVRVLSVLILPFMGLTTIDRRTVTTKQLFWIEFAGPATAFLYLPLFAIPNLHPALKLLAFAGIFYNALNTLPLVFLDGGRLFLHLLEGRVSEVTKVALASLGTALGIGAIVMLGVNLAILIPIGIFVGWNLIGAIVRTVLKMRRKSKGHASEEKQTGITITPPRRTILTLRL